MDLILDDKKFCKAGDTIILEEVLEGDEVSILAFTDGTCVQMMPLAQDHKIVFKNNQGPNNGGMGTCCPFYLSTQSCDSQTIQKELKTILEKVVNGLSFEKTPFVGVIFAGVMLTKNGPKVLEFNCRFGDSETQSTLPLLNLLKFLKLVLSINNSH